MGVLVFGSGNRLTCAVFLGIAFSPSIISRPLAEKVIQCLESGQRFQGEPAHGDRSLAAVHRVAIKILHLSA